VSFEDEPVDEVRYDLEWKFRAAAIPAAFLVALIFHAWPTGHWLQRTFLTMIPHELGHAITAWWSGHAAIPSLWKTIIFDGRGVIVPLLVAALNGFLVVRGWTTRNTVMTVIGLGLGGLQLLALTASAMTTGMAITFGGDAGAMVIGTLLVMTFFAPEGSRLRHGGLRWGLLSIGAAAFVDTFATWWSARSNRSAIPFGEIEGVGLSDPSKLEDVYGWSTSTMVDRYVLVGGLCLLAITAVWLWGIRDARQRMV